MIDGVKVLITKRGFLSMGGSLDNCFPIKGKLIKDIPTNGQPTVVRELYLPNPRRNHSLKVTIDEWGRIAILGSLRKWLFGKSSLADLTQKQCHKAVSEIAEQLHISPTDFMTKCRLTHIELGYNIRVQHTSSEIIKRVANIGKISGRLDYHAKHQTLYFNGADMNIKIYDKCLEIPQNIKHPTRSKKAKEMMDLIDNHGNHFIRIEIEMINSGSFKKYGLGAIKTFADILENWDKLHCFWVSVISRIKVRCPLVLSQSMTLRERNLTKAIMDFGFEKGIEMYAQNICSTKRSEQQIRRLAYTLLEKYPSRRTFNLRKLRIEVARKLISIHRHHEELPLSNLFHILWNTKHYRRMKRKRAI